MSKENPRFAFIRNFIRTILTEDDANEVFDLARVAWFCGFIWFLGLSTANFMMHGVFDPISFGTGFGGVLAGGGIGLGAKTTMGA